VVTSVARDNYDGKACQKLTIRFDRAGVKTISTALADLRPEAELPLLMSTSPGGGGGGNGGGGLADDPFMRAMAPSPKEMMLKIPDAATDPFSTARARLTKSLELYKYSDQGGSLLDWAVMQSGLRDPMSRFSRHELEDWFKRWSMVRDEHLKRLIFEVKKTEPGLLQELGRAAPRGAQQLLRRLDALR
jgi:hypothetical protein